MLILALGVLGSCHTPYVLTKSNRDEYAIDDKIAVDSAIIKTYLPYKTSLDNEMERVIGESDLMITKRSNLPESLLGNFFSDAVIRQAKKIQSDIDFAFPTSKGGLRNDIQKGPVKVSHIFELMPFENELILFRLKGSSVLDLLKSIAEAGGQPVAGLRMKINNGLPEEVQINGKPFDVNKEYNVLTSDYLASGGENARGFGDAISKKSLGLKIRDALIQEVVDQTAQGKKINTILDGRIRKN